MPSMKCSAIICAALLIAVHSATAVDPPRQSVLAECRRICTEGQGGLGGIQRAAAAACEYLRTARPMPTRLQACIAGYSAAYEVGCREGCSLQQCGTITQLPSVQKLVGPTCDEWSYQLPRPALGTVCMNAFHDGAHASCSAAQQYLIAQEHVWFDEDMKQSQAAFDEQQRRLQASDETERAREEPLLHEQAKESTASREEARRMQEKQQHDALNIAAKQHEEREQQVLQSLRNEQRPSSHANAQQLQDEAASQVHQQAQEAQRNLQGLSDRGMPGYQGTTGHERVHGMPQPAARDQVYRDLSHFDKPADGTQQQAPAESEQARRHMDARAAASSVPGQLAPESTKAHQMDQIHRELEQHAAAVQEQAATDEHEAQERHERFLRTQQERAARPDFGERSDISRDETVPQQDFADQNLRQ